MKKRRYDFENAIDFLENEAGLTPQDLRYEIEDAMSDLEPKTSLWHTLLTAADFLERIG